MQIQEAVRNVACLRKPRRTKHARTLQASNIRAVPVEVADTADTRDRGGRAARELQGARKRERGASCRK